MLQLGKSAGPSDGRVERQPSRRDGLRSLRRDPRRAVEEDGIVCLICGAPLRQLTNTHLQSHRITALAYKLRFGYNLRRPLMCLALRRLYAARAIARGLAELIRRRPILTDFSLRRRGGRRPITVEERLARQDGWRSRRARRAEKYSGMTQ